MTLFEAHVRHYFISVDGGETWETVPEESIESGGICLSYFSEKMRQVHAEDEDCRECPINHSCDMAVEFMVQQIQYGWN